MQDHVIFMKQAIELAKKAAALGEVPVGAVVVKDGEVIGAGYNLRENNKSATAHAEVIAIEEACKRLGTWRLSGCTLYVTLEPCPMCSGALINSRIDKVVYGCDDSVAGCCGSVLKLNRYPFNHTFEIVGGVLSDQCAAILKDFFEAKRRSAST